MIQARENRNDPPRSPVPRGRKFPSKWLLLGCFAFALFFGIFAVLAFRAGAPRLKFHGYMEVQLQGNKTEAAVFSFRQRLWHTKYLQLNVNGTGAIRFQEGNDWGAPMTHLNLMEYDNLNGSRIVLIPAQELKRPWRYDRSHEQFLVLKLPNARPRVFFKRKLQLTSGKILPPER